ncbi:hypothetical protein B0T13DRAFT_444459 [Neurospora crassa]|nr:hypothetical protein B0T13DRAFT_444459 [Neurospora crassa]
MSSTQKNVCVGKADQTTTPTTATTTTTMTTMTTTMTTTTLTVPDTNTTIQVTGTKVTIPASFGRPHRQPKSGNNNTTTTTTTKSDDAHSTPSAISRSKPSTHSGTCPHYKWQPSPSPSPNQTRRYHVPDCAKPRKGLMPTPAPMWWCPVCCSGPMLPWAEMPRESRKTGKEEEGKREEDEEDHQEYDWRHEDDFTDVWYDGMD